GLAARGRARADRRAPAARDVRPLGHRRPVHRLSRPDRTPDDLHLRRPSRRCGDHARRLCALRAARDRRDAADLGVPLSVGLPFVRAVAQVREPQRAAQQERRARAADAPALRL
ncbi:MAG: hypothetical protein AVDCRST_MAG88-406, partial [uncultured Thermomicrobiales bacterium]